MSISTPRYETVPISQIISRAKMQLRLLDTSQDNFLNILVCEALDHLNAASQCGKFQCDIDVCDQTAELPKGTIKLLGVRLACDAENVATNDPITNSLLNSRKQNSYIYADLSFLHQCGVSTTGMSSLDSTIQINKGHIHFNYDLGIDKICVATLGLLLDEHGNSVVFKRYERALWNYACSVYAQAYPENFNQYLIEKWDRTWVAQKNRIKGEDRMNEFMNDRVEIAQLMTALTTSAIILTR